MFNGKVIAITGGSDGIGRALTKDFLRLGAKVATCGRDAAKLNALEEECNTNSLFSTVADPLTVLIAEKIPGRAVVEFE